MSSRKPDPSKSRGGESQRQALERWAGGHELDDRLLSDAIALTGAIQRRKLKLALKRRQPDDS